MEFLATPLAIGAFILGAILIVSLVITAANRHDAEINSLSYALAYRRFFKILWLMPLPVLMMIGSSYIDHQQPSFHNAYDSCVTAEGPMKGDTHTTYTGSVARQASCVTIARQVIANWNDK